MAKQSQQQVKLLSESSVGQILVGTRDTFSDITERSRIQAIIDWKKEATLAGQIIAKDYRLQQCTEQSIANSFINVAMTGLTLNPIKQHSTLIARWNDDKKRYECQILIMYRGLMWLAGQAGVTDISVDVVYSADRFKVVKTDEGDKFEHEIAFTVPRDDNHQPASGALVANKFLGVYVAARMPGSKTRKVEWIPCEDIYKAREKSDSYLDREGKIREKSPWVWAFDEMAKKVGIKRAQKRWEEAVVENDEWKRFQTAVALDNANEGVIQARASDIPGTAEHVGDSEPPAKLSMAQLTELEKLAEKAAPNSDAKPNNTSAYLTKIARTYRESKLADVDASKFNEIKDRINEAIQKIANKKAADPQEKGSAKGSKDSGKQQDAAAKGGQAARSEGGSGSNQKGKGSAEGSGSGTGRGSGTEQTGSGAGEDHDYFPEDPDKS